MNYKNILNIKEKNSLENKNGITIIALVLTVIVLIILAGIGIGAITGDNGIIKSAKRTQENVELTKLDTETRLNELRSGNVGEFSSVSSLAEKQRQIDALTGEILENDATLADLIERINLIQTNLATIINDSIEENNKNIYPIGSIYITYNETNPGTFIAGTTWEQVGQGRTLMGEGSNGTTTYAENSTGGSDTISYTPQGTNSGGGVGNTTLTINQIPAHSHTFTGTRALTEYSGNHQHYANYIDGMKNLVYQLFGTSGTNYLGLRIDSATGGGHVITGYAGNHQHYFTPSGSISNNGGGGAHNHPFTNPTFTGTTATIDVRQPYMTVYYWKRTA